MVGRAYASTVPVLRILLRYWRGAKLVVNIHLGPGGKVGFMPVFRNGHSTAPVTKRSNACTGQLVPGEGWRGAGVVQPQS